MPAKEPQGDSEPATAGGASPEADATDVAAPIVVGIETAADAPAALWAADECARTGAVLHLVHCAEPRPEAAAPGAADPLRLVQRAVEGRIPHDRVTTQVLVGSPAPALLALSASARMIVLADQGSASDRPTPGATSWAIVSHSRCPVLLWRAPSTRGAAGPVVVGVDGSPTSDGALTIALAEASGRRVTVIAVMAWTDVYVDSDLQAMVRVTDWQRAAEDHGRLLAERIADVRQRFPDVGVDQVLTRDRPVRALLKHAKDAQLLVVGSHGRGGFPGMLLGSVSRALVDYSPCPLMVVPASATP